MKRSVDNEHTDGLPGARGVTLVGIAMAAALQATPAHASESLVLDLDLPLLAGLLVGFVALIFPVNQLIFKPIFKALDERSARIEGAKTRAVQIEREADRILSQYEERIREARNEADQDRKSQIAEARVEQASLTDATRGEAEQKIEAARATLAGEIDTARETLRASARDLAQSAAEQILGRTVS